MNRGTFVKLWGIFLLSVGVSILVGAATGLIFEGAFGGSYLHDPKTVGEGAGILLAIGIVFAMVGDVMEDDLQ